MAKSILKVSKNFQATQQPVEEETMSNVHFAPGTMSPRSLNNSKFQKQRKLDEIEKMKPVSYTLSKCTLRFNDVAVNQEYLKCQRQEVQTNAKYLLIGHGVIVGIVVMLLLISRDEEWQTTLTFMGAMAAPPAILLGIAKRISFQKAVCVDMFGLVYIFGYVLASIPLQLSIWLQLSLQERIQLDLFFFFFYLLYIGLLCSNFLFNFIGRSMIYFLMSGFIMYVTEQTRIERKVDYNLATDGFIRLVLFLIFEIIFYVQQKIQAKMFLSQINASQQQKQLQNLLDTVPDKVLICSQDVNSEEELSPLYSNQQMRQFYGEDLVKSKKKKVKTVREKQNKQVMGLNKAIFEPIQTNLDRDDQEHSLFDDFVDKRQLSIKEIVVRHQVSRNDEQPAQDQKDQRSSTVGCFKVKTPNPYASVDSNTGVTEVRSLQIKILDVLYNNQICSLVYIRDITSVINDYQREQEQNNAVSPNSGKSLAWGSLLVKKPDKFMIDLKKQIYATYGTSVSHETEDAMTNFKSGVDALSNSLRKTCEIKQKQPKSVGFSPKQPRDQTSQLVASEEQKGDLSQIKLLKPE